MRQAQICVAVIAWLAIGSAFAHGGGLDGYGCHHNRKQGGYHCHRGEFAGQHFASKQDMLNQMKKSRGQAKDAEKSGK
jgi:hypothetical protein